MRMPARDLHFAGYPFLSSKIILLLVSLMLCAGSAACVASEVKPNLIFFLTDDQGIDAIEGPGFPNDLDCHTPQLARFAKQGCVFLYTRANPTCSPTRAAVLTGRSSFETGQMGTVGADHPPFYRDRFGTKPGLCPVAEAAYERIVSLPIFPAMSNEDVDRVITVVWNLAG